jgi:hypothetical protein
MEVECIIEYDTDYLNDAQGGLGISESSLWGDSSRYQNC